MSADSRDLGGRCRSSCRSAPLVSCFCTGNVEAARCQAVREDAGVPEPGAGGFGVWQLPAPGRYQAKEHDLLTHQCREAVEVLGT